MTEKWPLRIAEGGEWQRMVEGENGRESEQENVRINGRVEREMVKTENGRAKRERKREIR